MPWRLGLGWGWSHQHTCKSLHTHTFLRTEFHPTHTQAVFPALTGCGGCIMASLWADVQLGMWDVEAKIPGKAESLGKECSIDRKVWIGNSRYLCVVKTEATVVNRHYHLWLNISMYFRSRVMRWGGKNEGFKEIDMQIWTASPPGPVTAAKRLPELIVAVLDNACVSTSCHIAAHTPGNKDNCWWKVRGSPMSISSIP